MSAKLLPQYGVFPTVVEEGQLYIKIGDYKTPIDISAFKVSVVDDASFYASEDVLLYGESAKGTKLVLRFDGTGTTYADGAVRMNMDFKIPEFYKGLEVLNVGVMFNKNKSSDMRDMHIVLSRNEDLGIIFSNISREPFVFSIAKNPKLISTLGSADLKAPRVHLRDNKTLEVVNENADTMFPIFGEFVKYDREVSVL